MSSNNFEPDRKKFWTQKYFREHKIYLAFSIVFAIAVYVFIYLKKLVELSPAGWVIAFIFLIGLDFVYFMRHMRDYVKLKLAEEERNGTAKDGFSTLDPNDPRFVDTDEE